MVLPSPLHLDNVTLANVTKTATFAGFLGFFLIGAVQAFYGPVQFALSTRFGIETNAVSLIVSAHFFGSTIGILGLSQISQWLGWRKAMLLGASLLSVGCFGVAFAPTWALALASAAILGLGFGIFDIGFNLLFSSSFEQQSTAMINLLAALFGLGAIAGPLIVGVWSGDSSLPFLLVGIGTLVLLPLLWGMRVAHPPEASGRLVISGLLGVFMLIFFVYVGVEVSTANLEPKHLRDGLNFSEQSAAWWNALYWGGMTASRLLIAPIALRFATPSIVIGSLLVSMLGFALIFVDGLAPYGYVLVGLGFGPVFPTAFVWLTKSLPSAVAAGSVVFAAANFGAVLVPPIAATLANPPSRIPSILLVLGMVLFALVLLLWQMGKTAK